MNTTNGLHNSFSLQKENRSNIAKTSASERIVKLESIRKYILGHVDEIGNATAKDMHKPVSETLISEILVLISEISFAKKNLKNWIKPIRTAGNLMALGTSSYVMHEPKGNTLIISPWNYPISLALKPLISAIAAGCVAIIKPSEFTPASSAFIEKLIYDLFDPNEILVIQGDATVAKQLLELPFDHIFFTGSTAVGKKVMEAASKNLTSVTLELGGKSPSIIDETCDIKATAKLIAWGKFFNNGQTCIAPDYLLVQTSIIKKFENELISAIKEMYGADGRSVSNSDSYGRIINAKQFERLEMALVDATEKGGKVLFGGEKDMDQLFIGPTLIGDVNSNMTLMQEEIFGPILPIINYENLTEVVERLKDLEKPLALYIHSKSNKNIAYLLANTSSGNVVVNEVLTHFGNATIPFGGVNHSGIGKSNGFYGFQEFSNAKGVVKRRFGNLQFLYPPYSRRLENIIRKLLKWI